MLSSFFTYFTELPEGTIGFSAYDATHLLMLAILTIYISFVCIYYKKQNDVKRLQLRKTFAIGIAVIEALRRIAVIAVTEFPLDELPLHLCGLSAIIFLWHAFSPNENNRTIIFSLSLPGAVAALLFPNWNMYPLANFFGLHSFFQHANLLIYPIMLLSVGELNPRFRAIWRSVVFLVVTGIPLYILNKAVGTNFMFLNVPSEGSPLVPLEKLLGNPGYIFGLAMLLFTIWVLMYMIVAIVSMIKKRRLTAYANAMSD